MIIIIIIIIIHIIIIIIMIIKIKVPYKTKLLLDIQVLRMCDFTLRAHTFWCDVIDTFAEFNHLFSSFLGSFLFVILCFCCFFVLLSLAMYLYFFSGMLSSCKLCIM